MHAIFFRFRCATLALLASAALAGAGDLPPDIRELQRKYDAFVQNLVATHTNRVAALGDEYRKALREFKAGAEAAGNRAAVEALAAEEVRYARERTLPATAPGGLDDVETVRARLAARLEQLVAEKNRALLSSAEKYDGLLADKEKKAAGNAETALAIRAERDRARQDPLVTAAEFELAMAGDAEPVAEAAPEPEEEPAAAVAPSAASAPAAPAGLGAPAAPAGAKPDVYPPGRKAPPQDPAAKKLTLSRSEHSPLATPVVVNASATTKSDTRRPEGYLRREEILDHWTLRLQLRTTPASGALSNLTVYVQTFIKSAQAQGRVSPEPLEVLRVDLERLTPEGSVLIYPSVDTLMIRERMGNGVWQYGGKELYGVLISVFDAHSALLYQGASIRGLLSEASAELPTRSLRAQVEAARAALEQARAENNGARMLFFANQRDEHNRTVFLESQARLEKAQKAFDALNAQLQDSPAR